MAVSMDCETHGKLTDAYLDGELDAASALAFESHAAACAGCGPRLASARDERVRMSSLVRESATYHRAPPALRAGVEAALARESVPPPAARAAAPARFGLGPLAAVAAAAVLASALTWWAASSLGGARHDPVGELVASHVRSLQVDHLTDIASSDRHAVKPWFAGKLDFTPPVADLAAEGYALRGGRLDYVDGRPVAAVAYQRRQHVINLFVWSDAGGDEPAYATQRAGFNVVAWRDRGLRFALVSDLGEDELRAFAERLRQS